MVSLRRRAARAITFVVCAASLSSPAWAQPANNHCSNAILVTDGSVAGTTIGATNDGAGTCGASQTSPDVWYRYVAPLDGLLITSTCGGATWDTVLGIWNGCPGSGSEIGCVDDSCGLQTTVSASITKGETYYIRVAGFGGVTGAFTLSVASNSGPPGGSKGPDVVYSDITDIAHYGPVGGIHAYAYGTNTCNIGDVDLRWGNNWGGSPSVGFNAYRLHDGRIMQLGQSWVKRACCAAALDACGLGCNGVSGSHLGAGCMDPYSAGYNGSHGVLAPRFGVNAYTGAHALSGGSGNDIFGRLQIAATDLNTANFPGALYFAEGIYVGSDDAAAGNAFNNASYKRLIVGGSTLSGSGLTSIGRGAIYAWHDHGLGLGVPDPDVIVATLDVPDEGQFVVGYKAHDLGNGTWRYDYAILNLNSDRSGGSFSVPVPAGTTISNVGFHDVAYHSGDPYDNTDWLSSVEPTSVTWSSPQTFAQNPNSNALRWGTLYNFWFDADRPPATGDVTLGLFKPHTPQSVTFQASVPVVDCPTDIISSGSSAGVTDIDDLLAVISVWGPCPAPPAPCPANIVNSGASANVVDIDDLLAVISAWGPCP